MNACSDVAPFGDDLNEYPQRNLAELVDDIDAVVWEADPTTFTFTYVSRGAERLLGYPLAQWFDAGFWEAHVHPEDRAAAVALCETATVQGLDHEFEYRMLAADGSIRWIRDRVRVGTDGVDGVTHLRGVLFDRTESRRSEDALRESEHRFRAIFESTAAGMVLLTPEGLITSSNKAAARMLGYEPEEVIGRNVIEFTHPDERADTAAVLGAASTDQQGSIAFERRCLHKDGHVVTTFVSGAAVLVPEPGTPYFVAQLQDISERKSLENRLHQAQKLEAIGRLAGGVAHDFNNLLLVVRSYATLLADDLRAGDPRADDLAEIRKAADAGADLTRQLLAFSRQQMIEPKVVPIECLVRNLERLLRRLITENISLVTKLSEPPCSIRIDPGQMEQVIVNLACNARDAMPNGGRLMIETALVDFGAAEAASRPAILGGDARGWYAMLAVSDTGAGMDEATRARVFEPFFTTKPAGKGTGLGLATVYGIVKQNDGHILVESEPGQGSTFRIYLPLVEESVDARHPESDSAPDPRGAETVLLVEDAPAVRAAVRQSLVRYGYSVVEAASGQAALDAAALHRGVIHLLLTDVVMPGVTGRELARRLSLLRPGTRVLYMSGYADDTIGTQGVLNPGIAYIAKPFSPFALARKVRAVLDAS